MAVTPITTAPTVIDASAFNFFNSDIGPVLVGSALYIPLIDFSNIVYVLKSTDSGATWTRMDSGSGAAVNAFATSTAFPGTGIQLFWLDEQTFVFATDLFQATVSNPDPDAPFFVGVGRIRSDGSVVLLWQDGNTASIVGQIFSGGGFAASFNVYTEVGIPHIPDVIGLVIDSSDVAHALYLDNDTGLVNYSTIVGASTVAGPVALADVLPSSRSYSTLANAGNLFYAYHTGGVGSQVRVEIATGATSNPATAVWTNYLVRACPAGSIDAYPCMIMDGADVLVFWTNEDVTSGTGDTILYAKWNGAGFDAPVVWYDATAHPPAGGLQVTPFASLLSVSSVSGQFVGSVAMYQPGFVQKTFYLANPSGPTSGYRHRIY